MASTYSTNLAIELIGTGDQAGTWGVTTNTNLGTLIEQAISGYVTQAVSTGADTTITIPNGATGVARNMYIELTGTGGTNTNLIVPSNKKLYIIFNNTASGQVTVKVSGQTGVSVPNGKKMILVSNGTDIVNGLNYIADFGTNSFTVTNLTATSATITNLIATTASVSDLSATVTRSASGTITNLIATSGSITNLVSSDASATVLRSASATLTHLSATSASITNLALTSLTISSLSITNVSVASATVSSNLTLSGGTANGVLYLNGSKVATSGSALVFDGTRLGIGTASPDTLGLLTTEVNGNSLNVTRTTSTTGRAGWFSQNSAETIRLFAEVYGASATNTGFGLTLAGYGVVQSQGTASNGLIIGTGTDDPLIFGQNNAEQMRLTSTGLGIGTSSPDSKLVVQGGSGTYAQIKDGTVNTFIQARSADSTGVVGTLTNHSIQFWTNSTAKATIDTSGNMGIGTSSPGTKLTVHAGADGDVGFFRGGSTRQVQIGTSSTAGYINTDNGSAGLEIRTQGTARLYLDNSGNLGIGTSSPGDKLHVAGTIRFGANASFYGTIAHDAASTGANIYNHTDTGGHLFQVGGNTLMNLNASGNLGLGVTPSAWGSTHKAIQVGGGAACLWAGASAGSNAYFSSNVYFDGSVRKYVNTAAAAEYNQNAGAHSWYTAPSGTAGDTITFTETLKSDASGTLTINTQSGNNTNIAIAQAGSIKWYIGNVNSDNAFRFYDNTAGTERARITSAGEFLVGTTVADAKLTVKTESAGTNNVLNALSLWRGTTGTAAAGMGVRLQFTLEDAGGNDINVNAIDSIWEDPATGVRTAALRFFKSASNTNSEAARITSGGYFKASNSGGYVNSTGTFHELRSDAADAYTVRITQSNATPLAACPALLSFTASAPNDTTAWFLDCTDNTARRAYIRSNGGLSNYQSNNTDLSDARTKKDIAPAASMWGKIGALEIVTYKYNDQTHDDVNVGVIAQQVESVEPVWVDSDGWGNETPEDGVPLKTVYTKDITFAAIKALQEAMARIEQLEAKVAVLESK